MCSNDNIFSYVSQKVICQMFVHEILVNTFPTVGLFLQDATCSRTKSSTICYNKIKTLPVCNVRKIRTSRMAAGVTMTESSVFLFGPFSLFGLEIIGVSSLGEKCCCRKSNEILSELLLMTLDNNFIFNLFP